MKILNFGSCNIDFVYDVDEIVLPGETVSAKKISKYPGGKGLNQSIALSRAGAKVFHAGVIGTDGKFLSDIMQKSGVDIRYLKECEKMTGQAIIQVSKNGENSIIVFAGSNAEITKEYIDSVLCDFSGGDFLLIQNEISNIKYLVDRAHEKGMKIIFNPSPFNEKIKEISLDKITYLILNEIEASYYSKNREFQSWVQENYPDLKVVLTLGKKGSIYFDKNTFVRQSAYSVKCVDTTAAGDTFTGYFIAAAASGDTPEKSLKRASVASAVAVSRNGAASSIPDKNEVFEAEKTLKESISGSREHIINEYFKLHYKDASLSSLAKYMGYSPQHASVCVKAVCGKPFSQLLKEARLKESEQLIRETDLPISDIIRSVGYSNENFFRKAFFIKYGLTPLAYRKEHTENERKKS